MQLPTLSFEQTLAASLALVAIAFDAAIMLRSAPCVWSVPIWAGVSVIAVMWLDWSNVRHW